MEARYLHLDLTKTEDEKRDSERSTEPTLIEVTAEDIAQGCTASATACPIARAIRRHLAPLAYVNVNADSFTVKRVNDDYEPQEVTSADLPVEARMFIHNFDNGHRQEVEPFTLSLPIPESFKRKDA